MSYKNQTNSDTKKLFLTKNKKVIIIALIVAIIIALSVTLLITLNTGGPYIGKVVDENGNPMMGISVTDGRNVVKTNIDGEFELRGYNKTTFITVTTPSGYHTEKFYIRRDKNLDSYDFVLTSYAANVGDNGEHTFMQISDTEIGENGGGDWLEDLKEKVDEINPSFLIHTGDICYEAGLKTHKEIMNTKIMGVPVRYVIGNHDYVKVGKYGEYLYESIYGPVWYSFEVGNIHYVVTPFQSGADVMPRYSNSERWKWLKNDLNNVKEGMQVVMFNHTKSAFDDYVVSYGKNKLDLKAYNLKAWIFGHYHTDYVYEKYGVLNISTARPDCGGIDSSTSSTRVITFDAEGNISTKSLFYDYDVYNSISPNNANWTTELNGRVLYSDALFEDNCLYVGTVDDNYPRKCGIYSLSCYDGKVNWFYETKNSIKTKCLKVGNAIIVQDVDGNVYSVNSSTGELIWEKQVLLGTALGSSTGIIADDEKVYTGCGAYITALKISTGDILWECKRNKGETSPAEFVLAGNKLLVSAHWNALAALDIESGKELWNIEDSNIRFRSSTPLIINENTAIVADSDAIMKIDLIKGDIVAINENEKFNYASSGQPCINGKSVYIPTAKNGVVEVNIDTLEIIRVYNCDKALVYTAQYTSGDSKTVETSPLIYENYLIFGASDGNVYAYILGDNSLKNAKIFNINSPVFSNPLIVNGKLYVCDFTGRVSEFNFIS